MKHYVFVRVLRQQTAWGGFENQLMDYFGRIDFSRCRVSLVSNHDIYSQELARKGLSVTFRPFSVRKTEDFHPSFAVMLRFFSSLKADTIILTQGAFTDFTFTDFLAAFIAGKGRVYSLEALGAPEPEPKSSKKYCGMIPGFAFWWYKRTALFWLQGRLCTRTIAIGNEVRDRLIRWYHYPAGKTIRIYHGIDLRKFRPDPDIKREMRLKFNIPENAKVIVSTARLSPEKCVDRLIEAFDQVNDPSAWLFIVGDGVLHKELKNLSSQKKSAPRIIFTGFQQSVPFLQMSDIFALPSDIEGLSNAMVEAMAAGLVVVITDVPGAGEVIEPDVTGFIVPKSVDGVKDGIRKALAMNEPDVRAMTVKARKVVVEKFDIQNGIKNCLEMLKIPMQA